MLASLAHIVMRRRWYVIAVWIGLTVLGAYSAQAVSTRWLEEFSIPGYSAYEANQRALRTFGTGAQPPHVIVLSSEDDVTKNAGVEGAIDKVAAEFPDFRVASYYSTGSRAYVSEDGRTTFATFYPPGQQGFAAETLTGEIRDAFAEAVPPGVDVHLTGRDALYDSEGGDSDGPSVLTEALIGGLGATIILLFVFGTLPAVVIPILMAIASILNTFTLIWLLTYITSVSLIVQFLVALVGLGVAIDYALLMIFRFRDELRHGR
jgi:putative drug exporter of the RND superfamily